MSWLAPFGAERNHRRMAAATAAAILTCVGAWSSPVFANVGGASASAASSVTSLSWGAVATPPSLTAPPSCQTTTCIPYSFPVTKKAGGYFDVWNSGQVALAGVSYHPTWVGGGSLTLYACSVPWDRANGSCQGTITTVFTDLANGAYYATEAPGAIPSVPGAEAYLHAVDGQPSPRGKVAVAMAVAVCSGGPACTDGTTTRQIRPATMTDS